MGAEGIRLDTLLLELGPKRLLAGAERFRRRALVIGDGLVQVEIRLRRRDCGRQERSYERRADGLAFTEHGGALHGIAQLTQVARPSVVLRHGHRLGGQLERRPSEVARKPSEERFGERRDIFLTFAELGQLHAENVQSVI